MSIGSIGIFKLFLVSSVAGATKPLSSVGGATKPLSSGALGVNSTCPPHSFEIESWFGQQDGSQTLDQACQFAIHAKPNDYDGYVMYLLKCAKCGLTTC